MNFIKLKSERHQMFGEQLDHVIMEWDTKQAIGEIFCGAFGSQMVLESYSNFINCLPDNLELIRKLCSRKKEFLEFCCQQQNIQGRIKCSAWVGANESF